jgi:hypothetical protein
MTSSKPSSQPISLLLLKNFVLMTTGGLALVILLIFVGIWQTGYRLMAGIEAFFNAPPATPKVDASYLIINQIRGISELTTAVFVMEAVVPTSQDNKLGNLVIGTTKLLYIAHGEVRAGIDLSRLMPDDLTIDNKTVRIHLPSPRILDSKIDVDRSRVYDYDRGFLGLGPDVAPQLQTLAQQETLESIRKTACEQGVLETANNRAKLAIAQLLTTAGYERIDIVTTPPPPDCK